MRGTAGIVGIRKSHFTMRSIRFPPGKMPDPRPAPFAKGYGEAAAGDCSRGGESGAAGGRTQGLGIGLCDCQRPRVRVRFSGASQSFKFWLSEFVTCCVTMVCESGRRFFLVPAAAGESPASDTSPDAGFRGKARSARLCCCLRGQLCGFLMRTQCRAMSTPAGDAAAVRELFASAPDLSAGTGGPAQTAAAKRKSA